MNNAILKLIKYFIILLIILFMIGGISVFIYSNLNIYNRNISTISDYNVLNLYFLNVLKENDCRIDKYGFVDNDENSYFIEFISNESNISTFTKKGNMIYFNDYKICENVDKFKIVIDNSNKTIINIELILNNVQYNMKYSL